MSDSLDTKINKLLLLVTSTSSLIELIHARQEAHNLVNALDKAVENAADEFGIWMSLPSKKLTNTKLEQSPH